MHGSHACVSGLFPTHLDPRETEKQRLGVCAILSRLSSNKRLASLEVVG